LNIGNLYFQKIQLEKIHQNSLPKFHQKYLPVTGVLFGAFDDGKMIGFSGIDGILIGSNQQYLELAELHVSYEYRSMGIGKNLFLLCVESALKFECTKLYIVASSSEESQRFYRNMGCVEAEELIPSLLEKSPDDVHMEYVLNP
jgi:predicted N-acetyltransferase YhbS